MRTEQMGHTANFDQALSALSNPYRRELLVALRDHNPQADDNLDPLDLLGDGGKPDVLQTELVHNHLPKLEEMGYITWDRDAGIIRKGPHWDDIARWLN